SEWSASSRPPANATPWTTASVGWRHCSIRPRTVRTLASGRSCQSCWRAESSRSIPARNARPAPRRTTTRTAGSPSSRSKDAARPSSSARFSAFRFAGRLSVTVPTPSTTVHRSSSPIVYVPPRLRERAHDEALVEHAEHLVDGGALPDVEERRVQELEEESVAPRLGLIMCPARAWGAQVADDPVLVVDRRVLDVVAQVLERFRVEDDDGNRLPALAVLLVQELGHDVGVAVGRLGERRRLAPAEALAVAPAHPERHPYRRRETS